MTRGAKTDAGPGRREEYLQGLERATSCGQERRISGLSVYSFLQPCPFWREKLTKSSVVYSHQILMGERSLERVKEKRNTCI